jgi:hypothetical protein
LEIDVPGICFFFEGSDADVWSGKDLDAWNYAIKVAGDIDKMIVINTTANPNQAPDVLLDFQEVAMLAEAEALMTGSIMYLTCPWDPGNQQSIAGHDHAVDWYVFGPAQGWANDQRDGYYLPQAGHGAVHSVHAATAVMFHRFWTKAAQ